MGGAGVTGGEPGHRAFFKGFRVEKWAQGLPRSGHSTGPTITKGGGATGPGDWAGREEKPTPHGLGGGLNPG